MAGADARVVAHTETGRLDQAPLDAAAARLADMDGAGTVSPPVLSADGADRDHRGAVRRPGHRLHG